MAKVLNARDVGMDAPDAVYCGRPSPFGNPFQVGVDGGSRTEVIEKHRIWFLNNNVLMDRARKELKGKDLLCWCAPKPCHCDIILEVANGSHLTDFFDL